MKYMSTNVLHDLLSARWIERHDGSTIRTGHADVIKKGSVRTSVFHHKTGFPWVTSVLCYFKTDNARAYRPVLNTDTLYTYTHN